MEQKSRLNEVALEHHKKLLNDQEEMSKKMGAVLDDTFIKLMARDQDVDREFAQTERRFNCHRVALDRAEDCIQALEGAMAIVRATLSQLLSAQRQLPESRLVPLVTTGRSSWST